MAFRLQYPLFEPESDWSPPATLPDLRNRAEVAWDTETKDDGLAAGGGAGWPWGGSEIVGISVATDGFSGYFPIRHRNGSNMDASRVLGWAKEQLAAPNKKIFFNAGYDIGNLDLEGIEVKGPIEDAQYAASLLDENQLSYSLDSCGKRIVGRGKDEKLLDEAAKIWGVDSKKHLYLMPAKNVGPYATEDAALTLDIIRKARPLLEAEDLTQVWTLECDLIPLWFAMRKRGLRINVKKAEKLVKLFAEKAAEIQSEINRMTGMHVDVWSGGSLASAFSQQGIQYPVTKAGNPTFRKDWLEDHQAPFAKLVSKCRVYSRAGATFLKQHVLEKLHGDRVFPEVHPLRNVDEEGEGGGAVSGRISYSDPPVHQVPARDPEVGPLVRSVYLPERGEAWAANDYSQQEPRLTVHYSALMQLPGSAQAVDYYTNNPKADYHQMVSEMSGLPRKDAKNLNLGLAYGMGAVKMCHKVGLPTEFVTDEETGEVYEVAGPEGKAMMAQYHERVPFVKELTKVCTNRAQDVGYIRTILKRRCRFDRWEPAKRQKGLYSAPRELEAAKKIWPNTTLRRAFTHKAMNRLIQGSAADMTKKAMRDMHREGILPMLQMHDELDTSVGDYKTAKRTQDVMREAVPLLVPVAVDGEYGKNWGEAKASLDEWFKVKRRK